MGRIAVVLLLIANHVVIALGLPIPIPSAGSLVPAGELFPCMNCPCGCRTAERCWRNCCCFSMTQKLAWAKAHGVEPPAFVREAAEREALSAAVSSPPKPKMCCPHCHKNAAAMPVKKTADQNTIFLMKALECQGLDGAGLLASLPALLPETVSFVPWPPPLLETISIATPLLPEVVVLVPEPPPRAPACSSLSG